LYSQPIPTRRSSYLRPETPAKRWTTVSRNLFFVPPSTSPFKCLLLSESSLNRLARLTNVARNSRRGYRGRRAPCLQAVELELKVDRKSKRLNSSHT